ncbi:MAG: endospore germination permease [Syntrophomonadaceae bacterium]|jgi:spore germination protein KB|nr:endospore germination permease [Syntrophomonadaceae bacterium]
MNDRVSTRQAWMMLSISVITSGILYFPTFLMQSSGRDAWLSVILTGLITLPLSILVVLPGLRFPGQNLIQYCGIILGDIPARMVGLVFVFSLLVLLATAVREFTDLLALDILPLTPIVVVASLALLVAGFSVYQGITIIGRAAELIGVLMFLLVATITVFSLPQADFSNLTPVLEKGWQPLLAGTGIQLKLVTQVALLAFILEKLDSPVSAFKAGIGYAITTTGVIFLTVATVQIVFPTEYGALLSDSVLSAIRQVAIGGFITRIEAAIVAIWVSGNFVRFSLIYYLAVSILAQVLNLKDHRSTILPTGLLAVSLSLMMFPNIFRLFEFTTHTLPVYHSIIYVVFFGFLLAVAVIRKKGEPTLPLLKQSYKQMTFELASFVSSVKRVYYSIVMPQPPAS